MRATGFSLLPSFICSPIGQSSLTILYALVSYEDDRFNNLNVYSVLIFIIH